MRYRILVASVAVAAAGAMALAGCSSSGGTSTKSSAAASGGSASAATKSVIPVGMIGSFSGPFASSAGGIPMVMKGWESSVNDNGGIDGHPVKLYVQDDVGDPAKSLAGVKTLVETDKVVALFDGTSSDLTWAAYVKSAGVPVIGFSPASNSFLTNTDFFSMGTNSIAAVYGIVTVAKQYGDKVGLIYCAESVQCAQAAPLYSSTAQTIGGVSLTTSAPVSATATDYTAVCQQVKSSGAQSLVILDAVAVAIRVAGACNQQGVTAKIIVQDGGANDTWVGKPGSEGMSSVDLSVPWFDTSTPATQAYHAALAKYAPSLGDLAGPNPTYAWVSGQEFEAAVKAAATDDITSAAVIKGLLSFKGETVGGLTEPLTYSATQPTQLNCWIQIKIVGGKWTEPNGLQRACAPASFVSAIAAKLGS